MTVKRAARTLGPRGLVPSLLSHGERRLVSRLRTLRWTLFGMRMVSRSICPRRLSLLLSRAAHRPLLRKGGRGIRDVAVDVRSVLYLADGMYVPPKCIVPVD